MLHFKFGRYRVQSPLVRAKPGHDKSVRSSSASPVQLTDDNAANVSRIPQIHLRQARHAHYAIACRDKPSEMNVAAHTSPRNEGKGTRGLERKKCLKKGQETGEKSRETEERDETVARTREQIESAGARRGKEETRREKYRKPSGAGTLARKILSADLALVAV